MGAYATKLSEGFAQRVTQIYYQRAVSEMITNQDYEGEIKDSKSKLNILTFGALSLKDYTGANLTADDPSESVGTLVTDQQKAFYFKIKSLDRFKSWIKNPEGTLLDQLGKELKREVDKFILSFWGDVGAGNWIGTDYTTGTVTVTTGTGAVVGVGTTFTAAMVGKPFKAAGHTKWYRVKTFTDGTNIVIEDDKDDETSAYTGGAIAGGSSYTIQANTAVQVTKSTVYGQIVSMATKLDEAEIPSDDRWLVVPAGIAALIKQAPEYIPAVDKAYTEVVMRGLIGSIAGFTVYQNQQVAGDGTNGWRILGGHRSAITMAMGFTENGIEDLIGNFGKAYKGLNVYGAKVVDERRKALVGLFGKL